MLRGGKSSNTINFTSALFERTAGQPLSADLTLVNKEGFNDKDMEGFLSKVLHIDPSKFFDGSGFSLGQGSVGDTFTRQTYDININIPNGSYTPQFLAETITEQMIRINGNDPDITDPFSLQQRLVSVPNTEPNPDPANFVFPSQSFMLTSSRQLRFQPEYGLNKLSCVFNPYSG